MNVHYHTGTANAHTRLVPTNLVLFLFNNANTFVQKFQKTWLLRENVSGHFDSVVFDLLRSRQQSVCAVQLQIISIDSFDHLHVVAEPEQEKGEKSNQSVALRETKSKQFPTYLTAAGTNSSHSSSW